MVAAWTALLGASCTTVPGSTGGSGGTGGQGPGSTSSTATAGSQCPNGPSDCPQPAETACGAATCEAGVCGIDAVADGTSLPVGQQVDGDCATLVCDGAGGKRVTPSADPEDDENACTTDVCSDGQTEHTKESGMVVCYTGVPASTLGNGPCASGMQQCNAGVATGPCVGEVLPALEDCDVAMVDEGLRR